MARKKSTYMFGFLKNGSWLSINTYYKYYWNKKYGSIKQYLQGYLNSLTETEKKNYILIGTNYNIGDPVENCITPNWECILVEPAPNIADALRKKYNAPNYHIENVGISDKKEKLTFYSAESISEEIPEWVSALNSFKKFNSDWLKEQYKTIEIKETLIETATVAELIEKHHIKHLNILQIDTEGYDYIILKSIDFSKIPIDLVIFEDVHLSPEEKAESKRLLEANNYVYFSDGHDTIGFRKNVYKFLLR